MADRNAKGRTAKGVTHYSQTKPHALARGSRNGIAKLTEQQVADMRHLRANGWTLARLSKAYGTCKSNVSLIARGEGWKHIP